MTSARAHRSAPSLLVRAALRKTERAAARLAVDVRVRDVETLAEQPARRPAGEISACSRLRRRVWPHACATSRIVPPARRKGWAHWHGCHAIADRRTGAATSACRPPDSFCFAAAFVASSSAIRFSNSSISSRASQSVSPAARCSATTASTRTPSGVRRPCSRRFSAAYAAHRRCFSPAYGSSSGFSSVAAGASLSFTKRLPRARHPSLGES